MDLLYFRIASVVVIAFIYMLFDVFNRRNVPSFFAYATVAYGAVLTILYFNIGTILLSALIAIAVMGFGYFVYKIGQLGLGDAFELAALSLVLPLQPRGLIGNLPTLGLPFIFSLLVCTGIAAIILVPLYYIPKSRKMKIKARMSSSDIVKTITIGSAYLIFIFFLALVIRTSIYGIALLIAVIAGSISIMLFEKRITYMMVDMVDFRGFEEGDIIAFNLMDKNEIEQARKKVHSFERLITGELIAEMKKKDIRKKYPVYKRGVPLAVPIFVGVVLALLFGNLIFLIAPAGSLLPHAAAYLLQAK
jgi:hypothetical protein